MFNLFKKDKEESWESIKASGKAFPQTKIAFTSFINEDDIECRVWINTGYKNYPYKKYCKILGVLNVDFEDMNNLDYGEVQDYFEKELNKACVSHLISRVLFEDGIEMLFYFESLELINNKLDELYKSDTKLVDFSSNLRNDENWEIVEDMLNEYGS